MTETTVTAEMVLLCVLGHHKIQPCHKLFSRCLGHLPKEARVNALQRRIQSLTGRGGDHEVVAAEVRHGLVGHEVAQELGGNRARSVHHKRRGRIHVERLSDAAVGRLYGDGDVEVQLGWIQKVSLGIML